MAPHSKKPRKRRTIDIPCYLKIDPALVARCLAQLGADFINPAAHIKDILHHALLQYALPQRYRTESDALEELHTYGVPLRQLLPRTSMAVAAATVRQRRQAILERERFLLTLEPPPQPDPEDETPQARLIREKEEAFHRALYGSGLESPPVPSGKQPNEDPQDAKH